MRRATILLAAGAAAVSTLAVAASSPSLLSAPPPPGTELPKGECILEKNVRNHTVADERTLLVNVYSQGVYRFAMGNACLRSAVSSDPIGIRTVGRSTICRPSQLDIMGRSGPCKLDSLSRLSPAEVAALPRRMRP